MQWTSLGRDRQIGMARRKSQTERPVGGPIIRLPSGLVAWPEPRPAAALGLHVDISERI